MVPVPLTSSCERPSPFVGVLAGMLIALTSATTSAQIVNVQPFIAGGPEKEGLSVVLEGAADIRRGNTILFSVSGSAIGQYRAGRHLFFLLARGEFAERTDTSFSNKDLEHARYRITVKEPLDAEVFLQHDRDAFRRLSLRALAGAGPRLNVARWTGFEVSLGAAYMLEHERLAEGDFPDSGATSTNHRLSTYVKASTQIVKALELGLTMYVQPRLDRLRDIRILSETALSSKATNHLALKLTFTSAFDAEPPVEVIPLDTALTGSIQASF